MAMVINKGAKVEAPQEFKDKGVVAFQTVEFIIDYYGTTIETSHDTRILEDGSQFVIGGCGFIPDGFEVK